MKKFSILILPICLFTCIKMANIPTIPTDTIFAHRHLSNVLRAQNSMAPTPDGIMAAPNKSEIKARVLRIEQSPQFSDKWLFELEILETTTISGPNFAHVKQRMNAFIVGTAPNFETGSVITAQAEFLGNQHSGTLQLTQIQVLD